MIFLYISRPLIIVCVTSQTLYTFFDRLPHEVYIRNSYFLDNKSNKHTNLGHSTPGRTWVSGPADKFSVFGATVIYYI